MKQLKLTEDQLLAIGFTRKEYPSVAPTEENPYGSVHKTIYEIACINGFFTCNNAEDIYVWYQKIIIGEAGNYICLDITTVPALYTILSSFRVKFNLIII